MKLKIIKIENRVVTCEVDGSDYFYDIARRWLAEDIQEGDVIEIEYKNEQ
ncbi:DUF3006 family protein [Kineothrix alysoides]|uniref:DUF3006 family protein n=1 Tax=Kineothrix alysoides TaxID=1469948 RepID=A0A4R1R0Z2_9FIRM|nr:DUF3006 family protein [Kineothrix alysoides]TCL58966.1 DUF3006 family protein [Kineothrix alysoides]